MWAFWKFVKAYRPNETDNFDEALKAADDLMSKYSQPLFRGYVMGFLEQKSFEAIRKE
jgi:hypothetical protein